MKNIILTFLSLFLTIGLFSQDGISGFVLNEQGEPLKNATIKVLSSNSTVTTDVNGYFHLPINHQSTEILIQHPIMKSDVIEVSAKNSYNITLYTKEITYFLDMSMEELLSLQ